MLPVLRRLLRPTAANATIALSSAIVLLVDLVIAVEHCRTRELL
jgi:hypothetical protein